jgi:hypothetical protein
MAKIGDIPDKVTFHVRVRWWVLFSCEVAKVARAGSDMMTELRGRRQHEISTT